MRKNLTGVATYYTVEYLCKCAIFCNMPESISQNRQFLYFCHVKNSRTNSLISLVIEWVINIFKVAHELSGNIGTKWHEKNVKIFIHQQHSIYILQCINLFFKHVVLINNQWKWFQKLSINLYKALKIAFPTNLWIFIQGAGLNSDLSKWILGKTNPIIESLNWSKN